MNFMVGRDHPQFPDSWVVQYCPSMESDWQTWSIFNREDEIHARQLVYRLSKENKDFNWKLRHPRPAPKWGIFCKPKLNPTADWTRFNHIEFTNERSCKAYFDKVEKSNSSFYFIAKEIEEC